MTRLASIFLTGGILLAGLGVVSAQQAPKSHPSAKAKNVPEQIDMSQTKVKENTESFVLPVPSEFVQRMRQKSYGGKLSSSVSPYVREYKGVEGTSRNPSGDLEVELSHRNRSFISGPLLPAVHFQPTAGVRRGPFAPQAACADAPVLLTSHTSLRAL